MFILGTQTSSWLWGVSLLTCNLSIFIFVSSFDSVPEINMWSVSSDGSDFSARSFSYPRPPP